MSTIQLASNTLAVTPATGQIEYNGQYYATDSSNTRGQLERITQMTVNAGGTNPFPATGGPTSVSFTGIPAWAKKITIMYSGVSVNTASSIVQIQIGSGSTTTSGYFSQSTLGNAGSGSLSTGFFLNNTGTSASYLSTGVYVLNLLTSNTWVGFGNVNFDNVLSTGNLSSGRSPNLSGALDRIVITTVAGTPTFTAGSINIMYEG